MNPEEMSMAEIGNANEFYESYVFIFHRSFSIQKKNRLFSALMAGEAWAWRVVGISMAALEALARNDFRYVKGTVCRAHVVDRISTAGAIFETKSKTPISQEAFFSLYFKNDETIITTKTENKTGSRVPSFIPIDVKLGLFPSKAIAWRHGRAEREYLRSLHAQLKKGAHN